MVNYKKARVKMAKYDSFKYEQPFEITKKGSRGTTFGFVLTLIYFIILISYICSQAILFFNFKADLHDTNILKLNFDDFGSKNYDEFQMGIGVTLHSLSSKFENEISNAETLAEYISVESNQAYNTAASFNNTQKLISCDGIIDLDKFKRLKTKAWAFCVDPEVGYKVQGNLEYDKAISMNILVQRCKETPT